MTKFLLSTMLVAFGMMANGAQAQSDSIVLLRTQVLQEDTQNEFHITLDHQGILDSLEALGVMEGREIAAGITNIFALYDSLQTVTAIASAPDTGSSAAPLTFQISSSNDDVEEMDDPDFGSPLNEGEPYFDSSDLELVTEGYGLQIVGLRFTDINIPQGATISNAYIQFTVDEVDTIPTSLTIAIEDLGDAAQFWGGSGLYTVSSRSYLASTVDWNDVPAWTTAGESGEDQATPDLSTLLQAVVNRSDWVSGNAVVFKIEGSGSRTAESFDGDSTGAPKLVVELAEATGGDTTGGDQTCGCENPAYENQGPCQGYGYDWFGECD